MQLQGKFQGKIALVTGGSRGMGREMVRAFAAEGADVVIASRKLANCQQVADEVTTQYGIRALPVEVNVSDWDACGALVDQVYDKFGQIDILVNNAGLSP
ncbi:MAG: SDR family NAD(P)-dependent oxidoreductase, partial [Antricoccus sp.]